MTDTSDLIIVLIVVGARFLLPLVIPRYPLPGVVGCLVLDGIDQTIFQKLTQLPLEHYQGYDKALDIYYLTIAYISTLRNWSNLFAFKVSRFLYYYRLVGVALFELSQLRPLLIIFPNTFEYFFIFYEACRVRWDPRRLSHKVLIGAAAFIWIVIKLPQEYIIHIAQVDTTDWIKTTLFHVSADASWAEAFAAAPGIVVAAVVLVVLAVVAAWWVITRRLPPADWRPRLAADPAPSAAAAEPAAGTGRGEPLLNRVLVEKIALVSLVSIIFAQILPGVQASGLVIATAVAVIITVNAALSHWLARRGRHWSTTLREFLVMSVVNFGLTVAYALLAPSAGGSLHFGNLLFFALLLTLIVTLFDHFRREQEIRFGSPPEPPADARD